LHLIFLQLNGMYGSSDDIPLVSDNSSTIFLPSSSPEFRIRASDVGVVTSLGIKLVGQCHSCLPMAVKLGKH
jgi:hypothetical protein